MSKKIIHIVPQLWPESVSDVHSPRSWTHTCLQAANSLENSDEEFSTTKTINNNYMGKMHAVYQILYKQTH